VFRNGRIAVPGTDNAQFLLNCAGSLALPADLAALLARRSAPPSLGYVGPLARILSRAYAIGAGPLAVLVLGWSLSRKKRA
jgi:hypothetical protein